MKNLFASVIVTLFTTSATAQLPFDQREVIMLHFQGRMTFKRIARAIGISVNTAKSLYRYGFDKLRSLLDDEEDG